MSTYGFDLKALINLLDPQANRKAVVAEASGRKARTVKTYVNPETGERVETKSGNHKVLRAWRSEFGADVVESWLK